MKVVCGILFLFYLGWTERKVVASESHYVAQPPKHHVQYQRYHVQYPKYHHAVQYPKYRQAVYYPKKTVYPKNHHYYNKYHYKYKYKYKYPYYKKKITWPKIRGRCKIVPDFEFKGTNPVLKESGKDNVVVLILTKRKCKSCLSQLDSMNDLAQHYRHIGWNISFVAINHKLQPFPKTIHQAFPFLDIYEEPANKNIFGQLNSTYRSVLVYDKCGRQQYKFGWPYSWLTYPFVRSAIQNTRNHHIGLCGICKPSTTISPGDVITSKVATTKYEEKPPKFTTTEMPKKRFININGPLSNLNGTYPNSTESSI